MASSCLMVQRLFCIGLSSIVCNIFVRIASPDGVTGIGRVTTAAPGCGGDESHASHFPRLLGCAGLGLLPWRWASAHGRLMLLLSRVVALPMRKKIRIPI